MVILKPIASNWSRSEREKLNNNWTIIENYLSNLQGQINLLTGDVNVQELIDQLNQLLSQSTLVLEELESALANIETIITNAQNATDDANNAAQSALNAVNDIQSMIDNFQTKGTFDMETIYAKNNSVLYEGSSYIYINNTPSKGNPPPNYPIVSNDYWHMTAAKGASGEGAVSKVNGKEPNAEGEIILAPSDIGAASSTKFDEHVGQDILSENGAHGIRYFNDKLEFKEDSNWNEIKTGIEIQDYSTGHLDDLKEPGFYVSIGSTSGRGFPVSTNMTIFIKVHSASNGVVYQKIIQDNEIVYSRFFIVSWSIWRREDIRLNDTLTSTSTSEAATANAVRQVNDKLVSDNVAIGKGTAANSAGTGNIALGLNASATNGSSVAIGYSANSLNNYGFVLGIANHNVTVPGKFSVSGTKNFEIPHPHPDKRYTHVIRHGAVESPTAGDTLYRYSIDASGANETVVLQLPDYFQYLNKNVDVYVSPHLHFGNAFGIVEEGFLKVTCEKAGHYKALVIGTRNDDHDSVQTWDIKGVEREIGESWTGETHLIEVDEISEITEFEEVF